MRNKRLISLTAFAFCLVISIQTSKAQFQSFPQTTKTSISGEKVKSSYSKRQIKNSKRYIENNSKKKKIKTSKKFIRSQSCSNFSVFISEKANRRQKALNRQRRRSS
jgi:hypothetical protein